MEQSGKSLWAAKVGSAKTAAKPGRTPAQAIGVFIIWCHYGVVEFSYDAQVRLGFLTKTVSGTQPWEKLQKMGALGRTEGAPVSFYVEVIPIGEKPAARTIVVGAKLFREADGTVTYNW